MDKPKIILLGLVAVEIAVLVFGSVYAAWLGIVFLILNVLVVAWLKPFHSGKNDFTWEGLDQELPQLDATVRIAHETLPYMRRGLNQDTAAKIAELVQEISEVAAVAITDTEKVLAYVGVGCDKHHPGDEILTEATKQVLAAGVYKVVRNGQQLNCPQFNNCKCPLEAAVIVPLKCKDATVGTIKLYQTKDGQLHPHVIRLAIGVAQLLSMQMELAELDRQSQLATKAELDALQAQINPHFFFNTLNTIIMYSRTNPNRARRLLIRLSEFFRLALKRHGNFISFEDEMNFVNTYLVLEKARFGPKLQVIQDIEPGIAKLQIPRLTLQPLVENAIKHGITPKLGPGAVKITAKLEDDELLILVKDDGVGIPPEKLGHVLISGYGSGNGVGLSNVHERLKSLFGENYGLKVRSTPNRGTSVVMRLPINMAPTTEKEA